MAHFFTSHKLEYILKQLNNSNASSLILLDTKQCNYTEGNAGMVYGT